MASLPHNKEAALPPSRTPSRPSPYSREEVIVTDSNFPGVVEFRDSERPIMGRIFLVEPPDRPYFKNITRIDPFHWRRIYNLLRCYASRDGEGIEEWLRLDTFAMLYQHIFREKFEHPSWGYLDLLKIFCWIVDWVDLDIDNSGFGWVHLREEWLFFPAWRAEEFLTFLKNLERENQRKLERKEAAPISVSLPMDQSSDLDDRLRKIRTFTVLLECSPMDSIQLQLVYNQKFPSSPVLPPNSDMFDFCEAMGDVCKFDQKSPVHGLVYPRLDLEFQVPADFDLGHLAQAQRKVQRKLAARRLARPLRRRTLGRQRR